MFIEEYKNLVKVKVVKRDNTCVLTVKKMNQISYKGNIYEVISDDNLSGFRVKVVEKDGLIYIYKPIVNELICTHEIPIGQGRILLVKKGNTDIDSYKIAINRFFGKNHTVDKYFENAIRQQNPMYHLKHYRRIDRMTSFYTKEEILEAMKYCIDNDKCSVFELSSYLVYKLGRERARVYLHDMELSHFTKRAKEIEKEFEYGSISNIKQLAKTLNLSNVAKGKINLTDKKKSDLDFLESIFLQEIEFRRKNRIKLLKENSNLPNLKFKRTKLQDGLIWQINKIEKLEFISECKNILISGSCNKGKTLLVVEICNVAIEQGNKVICITLDEYMDIMKNRVVNGKEVKKYKETKNSDIIVIDDFLYLNLSNEYLLILYKTILSLNESHSLIIISNRKIQNFVDAVEDKFLMNTLVDRLKNNSHIVIL